jgi:hypothetical protein
MWIEERAQITPEVAQPLKILLAVPVAGSYCSIGAVLLGLIIAVSVGALRVLPRVQWSILRSWKG